MKLRSPHILLASSNVRRMLENIRHLLSKKSQAALQKEIDQNVIQLYRLGVEHFEFAKSCSSTHWRQKVSRYYYAAYCFSRSVRLHCDGIFTTDPTDHQQIGNIPAGFPNSATYSNKLKTLREDRNLADYSHSSAERDLILTVSDAHALVGEFMKDTKAYFSGRGLRI